MQNAFLKFSAGIEVRHKITEATKGTTKLKAGQLYIYQWTYKLN